jgi:hypothetical protein
MSEGTILELVSRGKKDAYQIQGAQRTWFGSPYERRSPSTREVRAIYPENPPRFGQWFDIVIPPDGDVLVEFELRITMPTWLPEPIATYNTQPHAYLVQVESQPYEVMANQYITTPPQPPLTPFLAPPAFLQYGWCDGIANYLIGRWALYVDNIMILDGYGEFNTWFPDMETTQLQAPVIHAATGRVENGSDAALQKNATLSELVFRVPIPGCQRFGYQGGDVGLPICAFKNQRIYIRFWLLDKTELVCSSTLPPLPPVPAFGPTEVLPMYELCPAPWGGRRIKVNEQLVDSSGNPWPRTLTLNQMGQPQIYARCVVLNLENELRRSMSAQKFEIRFHQQLRDDWTVENQAFVPGVNYRRLLTINGIFQTLFVGFRANARVKQNRFTDILPAYGNWLTQISLNVNGLDRILSWSPKKLKVLANNTQLARDVNIALYYLIFGISPEYEPGGTCNLSRCQKAVLNLTFNDVPVDPMTGTRITYGFVVGNSWNVLDIEGGVASLRFPN